MQKNFTKLIAHFLSTKRYTVPAGALLLLLATSLFIWAAVLPIQTQNISVSADTAVGGPSANFTVLGPIVVEEVENGDFSGNGNLTFTAPVGWAFRPTGVSTTIIKVSGTTSVAIDNSKISYNSSTAPTTITIPYTLILDKNGKNEIGRDKITITGVAVQAQTGAVQSNKQVTLSASGATVSGLASPVTVANLSQTFGAAAKVGFTIQPVGADVNTALSTQPIVAVQDWFGNTVTSATGNIGLALTGTPATALIATGGTAAITNGVAQFSNVSIDEGGTFQLLASYSTNVQGTSSAFVINNKVPTISAVGPCMTAGSQVNTITVTGTNFVRGSVVRVNESNRATTFINSTTLSAELVSADINTAQTLTLTVFNPTPAGGSSGSVDFVIHPVYNVGPITGDAAVCEGTQSVTYSVEGIGATAYSWTVGSGATYVQSDAGNSITVDFGSTASTVTISVVAINACGQPGTASELDINVTPQPVGVSAGTDRNICSGAQTTLGSGDPAFADYIYEWAPADATSPAGALSSTTVPNPTLTLPENNGVETEFYSYTLTVKNKDNTDCQVVDEVLVGVYPEMVVAANDVLPVCVGGTIELVVTGDVNFEYAWTGPNGFTSDEQSPVIPNATTANSGEYTVEVTNLNGCVGTDNITVSVVPLPTADAGEDEEKCAEGASTSFTVSGTATDGAGIWSVIEGTADIDAPTSASTQVDVSSASATLLFTVENSDGCTVSDEVVLTVNPLPVVEINGGETVTYFCTPGIATLSATENSDYDYAWFRVAQEGETEDVQVGATQNISVSAVGDYYVIVTDGNGCPSTSTSIAVQETIVGNNIVGGENNSQDQEICYGATPVPLDGEAATSTLGDVTYKWQSSADGENFVNMSGAASTAEDLELGSLTATTWYRRLATVGFCVDVSNVVQITVKPELKLTSDLTPDAICSGGTFSYTPTSATTGATFSWTRATIAGNSENSGDGDISEVLTNNTAEPIIVIYSVLTSANDCSGTAQEVKVVVNPTPQLSNIPTAAAVCSGATFSYTPASATAGATFSWTRAAVEGISNAAVTTPVAGNISEVLTNSTSAPIDVTYSVVTSANDCEGPAQTFTVTVNPVPTANAGTYAAQCVGAGNQTIFNLTNGTVTNGTPTWTFVSGTNGATATITGANTMSPQVTVTGTGTVNIRLTANSDKTPACGTATDEVVLTVNPTPTANAGDNQTKCAAGATTPFTLAGTGSNGSFLWEVVNTTDGASVSIQSPTQLNSGATFTGTGTATLRLTSTSASEPACGTATDEVVLTVNPLPTANAGTYAAQCVGANNQTVFNLTNGTITNGTPTWAFVSGTNNATATITGANTMSPQVTVTGTGSVTISLTATSDKTPACASVSSNTVLTVNPLPTVNAGSTQTGCQAIVNGLPAPTTFTLNGTSNVSNVTWSVVTQPSTVSNVSFSNANTLNSNVTITGYGSVVLRLTATGAGNCVSTSDVTINVTQRKKLTLVLEADPFPVCPGTNTRYKATVYEDAVVVWNVDRRDSVDVISFGRDVSDQFTFDWWKNDKVDNQQGQTGRTRSQAGLSSTDYYTVRATYNGSSLTCNYFEKTFSTGLTGADLYSNRIYLGYPEGYGVNVTANPGNVICAGTSVTFTATANATYANPVWQWQVNGTNVQGATTNEFTISTLKNGDVVRVLFGSAETICGLQPVSNEITMTVNALPAITSQPATPKAVCAGQTVEFTVGATGTGITYQWYKRASNAQSAGSPVVTDVRVTGATTNKLSISNTVASDAGFYYAVVSGTCSPAATSNNAELYITPLPTAYNVTGGGSYCQGGTGVPVGLNGSEVGVRYQLLLNGSNVSGATIDGTGAAISFGNRTAVGTYTVKATSISGITAAACPRDMLGSAVVAVNQLPTVTVNSPTTCAGIPATVTAVPSGGSGTYTAYTWTVPGGATNPGNVATFQTTIAGTYTVKVTDNSSCESSAAATSTVTVNDLPTVTVTSPTVCQGDVATVTATPTGGTGPYTYNWVVPQGVTNPGSVASFQTTVAGNYTVSVMDSKACVSSQPATGTVTVNPLIDVIGDIAITNSTGPISATNPIMFEQPVTFTAESNITDNGDARLYIWYTGSEAASDWEEVYRSSTSNVFTLESAPADPFDVKVEVSPEAAACYAQSFYTFLSREITPLPVEIIYLNASKQGNNVVLEWATAMEQDNKGFEVQVSTDGFNYRLLTFVPAKNGNASSKQEYVFTDKENGKFGTRYYRLKQIDTNGTYEFFGPKAVTFGSVASKVIAFPNPFHDEVTLDIASETAGEALITVTDAVGKQLLVRKVQVEKGFTTEKLRLDADMPRGLYIIKTQVGGVTQYIKMIKE